MSFIRNISRDVNAIRPALDDAQIARLAPAVFAPEAHSSRSARFAHIPTFEMLSRLRAEGFEPVQAMERRTRIEDRRGYTKHMIRFRHAGDVGRKLNHVGDTVPEVVLVNGHDGTATYQLYAGTFRLVCMNGMIVGDNMKSVRVPHKGDVVSRVIEGSYEVLNESARALEAADAWAGIELNQGEREIFAEAAHALRFADAEGNVSTHVEPARLLAPRRADDRGNDLWRTFNVVQENAVRGGLRSYDAETRRYRSTREVGSIDGNVALNRSLWMLTERMAALKGA